jgi:hypothetical protein
MTTDLNPETLAKLLGDCPCWLNGDRGCFCCREQDVHTKGCLRGCLGAGKRWPTLWRERWLFNDDDKPVKSLGWVPNVTVEALLEILLEEYTLVGISRHETIPYRVFGHNGPTLIDALGKAIL